MGRSGAATMGKKADGKVLAQNKKASHDYFIEDTYECGLVLTGTEIKSIRLGKANIGDAFALIRNGEAFIHNMHISFRARQPPQPERSDQGAQAAAEETGDSQAARSSQAGRLRAGAA